MRGLFFVGTDTGVGKTHVTAAVARLLRQQGRAIRVCKPVATGGEPAEDTQRLAEASGLPAGEVTFWTFPVPAAPPVAARAAGAVLHLREIVAAVQRQGEKGELLLVEGVGGLLCPLTDAETVADLAGALGLPLVVVARRSLGTLNHTLLTLEVARGRDLDVAGVVVSETTPPDGLADETNPDELARRIEVPLLAVLPYGADERTLGGIDWWRLAGARALGDTTWKR
jgi:dethiobiotin synthetase